MDSQTAEEPMEDDSAIEEGLRAAELAIAELAASFAASVSGELARARALLEEAKAAPGDGKEQMAQIFGICHNLKGQAGSFGYGLMGDIAGRICSYLRTRGEEGVRTAVVDGHLMALEFVADRGIKGDGDAIGRKLLAKLAELAPPDH